jgi:deoxyguanosine kinase
MSGKFCRQIAVEGCIGAGKTTWAEALARVRHSSLVLEEYDKNPFLAEFYADPIGNVLETELHFLLIHYHQLKRISNQVVSETIADFSYDKDAIFADLNVSEPSERGMFGTLYRFLSSRLRAPDLVIYLRASDQLIFERIRRRNRSMEQDIDIAYFAKLNRAYEDYFTHFAGPRHVIDADQLDCVKRPELVTEVSKSVDAILGLPCAS